MKSKNEKTVPPMVRTIAIVLLASAIFLVCFGSFIFLISLFGQNFFFGFRGGGPNVSFLIISLLQIILGISGIILARGLFKAKSWARKYAILLIGITTLVYMLMILISFFVGPISATSSAAPYALLFATLNFIFPITSFVSGILYLILNLVVSVFFIYSIFYLYSDEEVREAFQ